MTTPTHQTDFEQAARRFNEAVTSVGQAFQELWAKVPPETRRAIRQKQRNYDRHRRHIRPVPKRVYKHGRVGVFR